MLITNNGIVDAPHQSATTTVVVQQSVTATVVVQQSVTTTEIVLTMTRRGDDWWTGLCGPIEHKW